MRTERNSFLTYPAPALLFNLKACRLVFLFFLLDCFRCCTGCVLPILCIRPLGLLLLVSAFSSFSFLLQHV